MEGGRRESRRGREGGGKGGRKGEGGSKDSGNSYALIKCEAIVHKHFRINIINS